MRDAGGRPEKFLKKERQHLRALVQMQVGLAKLTVAYCKQRLPVLRRVSKECIRQTLVRMGYAWRLRRSKVATPRKHKPQRSAYADSVLNEPQKTINRFAFVDGTTR